ncbi:DNA replication/repair protein RecF [Tsuneonella sp. CC-YZS046]|uniref:DNA replication/repair protein RecF n=1 Tax=Tsuneonella sp. CC-YZS046 TaxID=3042152 RepID=UPI002D76F6B2|nr:DNA replication/repair protein RecF [Tsuneonella sp. CC-YZS046]WRO67025.1 DNA replication/repair protein RecF [Tsuneonella sp. CC-YZS046]
MPVDRLILSGFRNHAASSLDGTRRFNLLVGENGAGKTNILEALSLFAPGRGLRRAALTEMAAKDGGGFSISAELDCTDGAEKVKLGTGTRADQPRRRVVQVNGAPASAITLAEWLTLSWLTPAMDRLFMDSAGGRRRLMDRLALALDPAHARHAARYEAALRERNRLLSGEEEADAGWLDAVEAQLAEAGAPLAAGRRALVERLQAALEDLPDEPFARPALTYLAGSAAEPDALLAELRANRARDRSARRTLAGPHRDELAVAMASKAMPAADCSTGEQKAMLISIILAHAALAAHGRPGLLLLDEIAAHLDPLRREALFERLRGGNAQVWMTGTELAPFEAIKGEAAIWKVHEGAVERIF